MLKARNYPVFVVNDRVKGHLHGIWPEHTSACIVRPHERLEEHIKRIESIGSYGASNPPGLACRILSMLCLSD